MITYLFGDYDSLKNPTVVTPGWDYICVSDKGVCSDIWRPVVPDASLMDIDDPKRKSSFVKIAHHLFVREPYDTVMTIDASIRIQCNLDDFLSEFYPVGCDILIARHPYMQCLYQEADAVLHYRLDDPDVIKQQVARYRSAGFPALQGLYSCGLIVKSNVSKPLRRMCDIWWKEYMAGSRRDQLSFTYAKWLLSRSESDFQDLQVSTFDRSEVFKARKLFEIIPHRGDRRWGHANVLPAKESISGRLLRLLARTLLYSCIKRKRHDTRTG